MARVARIRATRMSRGTSPSGRQLCPARGVSRGIASHVNPSPQGRHFDDRKAPGGRQRASRMMLNNRCTIRTSMPSAAPEGAWREATAQFPQAYAVGLKNLSPQGASLTTRSRHETCHNAARRPCRARSRYETCHNGARRPCRARSRHETCHRGRDGSSRTHTCHTYVSRNQPVRAAALPSPRRQPRDRVARRPTAGLVPRPCPTPACGALSVRRASATRRNRYGERERPALGRHVAI